MLIFVVVVAVIMLPIFLGLGIGWVTKSLDTAVTGAKVSVESKDKGYNPNMTFGHKIKVQAGVEQQMKEARLAAAKQAASLPRGANMGVGHAGASSLKAASKGLQNDPQTAVKIAAFHGWDGARTGIPAGGVAVAPAAPVKTAAAPAAVRQAAPSYQLIPITDSMSPEEKRKAIIANSKAKSAAMKAAKAAGEAVEEAAAPVAAATTAPVAKTAVSVSSNVPEPEYIDITPNMSPEDVRKARIENSKRKSAYQKALKAAGVTIVEETTPAAEASVAATGVAAAQTSSASVDLAGIPKPDYIEITPSLSPDEVRRARIENSKRKSAYQKALKAAGIDPATVSE